MSFFVLVLAAGCMGGSNGGAPLSGAADTGADTSPAADSADMDTAGPSMDPRWVALDAQLEIASGELAGMTLLLRVFPEDPSLGVICEQAREVESFEVAAEPPDPVVYRWWALYSSADSGDCAAVSSLPRELGFGIGELYSELEAALVAGGSPELVGRVYGAYAAPGEGLSPEDVYAYGYAGTSANLDGSEPPGSGSTLPDGVYQVTSLYLFGL